MLQRALLLCLAVDALNREYDPEVIKAKPNQVMMALVSVFFSLACWIGILALFSISTPGSYMEKVPTINKEF